MTGQLLQVDLEAPLEAPLEALLEVHHVQDPVEGALKQSRGISQRMTILLCAERERERERERG